ncbi:MAG: DUF445 domain-containing protein [Proteobacteria bacterium]|nr:DUF445 domain-containing protein [Pseudomonadota bacterium]
MLNSARLVQHKLDKSLLTNLIAALLIGLSYCFINTPYQTLLSNIGLYALSCALTNWLAIIMLFDKVPFIYGSGVVPAQFEAFKGAIKNLMLSEFFTSENVQNVLSQSKLDSAIWHDIADKIDYDKMYSSLVEAIFESKIGSVFFMMGGQNAIEPLREPVKSKCRVAVQEILADEKLHRMIMEKSADPNAFLSKIESVIDKRLAMLTPKMVKEIIQKMIAKHLGWLVVWGGVFGGFIGLIASLV